MLNFFTLLAQDQPTTEVGDVSYSKVDVGFQIPSFDAVLTFIIRGFFIVAGLIALFLWVRGGFSTPIYDTIIYGIGFGILFILSIDYYSIWMKILLWTRLIEEIGSISHISERLANRIRMILELK